MSQLVTSSNTLNLLTSLGVGFCRGLRACGRLCLLTFVELAGASLPDSSLPPSQLLADAAFLDLDVRRMALPAFAFGVS